MAGIDRYAGLIVSMHRTGLWKNRYDLMNHPIGYNLHDLSDEVREFIDRNERWQEEERKSFDPDQLRTNYRLMQIWDLLGLYFCNQDPYEDYIDPVPTDYSGHGGSQIRIRPSGTQVVFEPYPFDTRPCHVQLAFKRLPHSTFENVEEFQRAYFKAESDLFRFELV